MKDVPQERESLSAFLRWAGGKQSVVRGLVEHLPADFDATTHTYFEPFLGAGSLLLNLAPKRAIVSDLNPHLITVFTAVKESPGELSRQCRNHERKHCREYYYRVRTLFNQDGDEKSIKQASRFLYLNRACFNGIFRVNTQGKYNVPFGEETRLLMPSLNEFKSASHNFSDVEFRACSYENILNDVSAGDFVYLDPPYPPLNGTAYFTHYTKERFGTEDQERVAEFANDCSGKGARVLMTNADTELIRRLYRHWTKHVVSRVRYVSCKSTRHRVSELIIANYKGTRADAK